MGLVEKTGISDRETVFRKLQEEGYKDIYVWRDPPNAFYDWHTHTYDEVRWILKGKILIGTEEGEYLLEAGDKMIVPAGTRHWAKVGDEGVEYVCASRY